MPHKARTLLVTTQFPPPMMGGTLVYYSHITCRCRQGDYFVMAPRKKGDDLYDKSYLHPIFRTHLLDRKMNPALKILAKPLLFFQILIFALKNKISVIHVGDRYPLVPVVLVAKLLKIQILRTFVGEELANLLRKKESTHAKDLRDYRFNHKLDSQLDAAQVICRHTGRLLHDYLSGPERILLTIPCPDTTKISIQDVEMPEVAEKIKGKKVLITVGRFEAHKGHEYVIRSLPGVLEKYPDLLYVMVVAYAHDSQVEHLLQVAKELDVSNQILILRNLEAGQLVWMMKQSTVFIMPNRNLPGNISEGYGIVFLEAGLFRLPCIGGNAGGVPEAVEDGKTGLLVDGSSIPSISQAILRLLDDPELCRELGSNGYRKAMGSNWDDRSLDYQNFLDKLVS